MRSRRRFISALSLAPLASMGLLTACREKSAPAPAAAPPPAPVTSPAPAAAPTAATPAPPEETATPAPTESPAAAPADSPAASPPTAAAAGEVSPEEPLASSLGYVTDTTQVNAQKYPGHAVSQACSNCALYSGQPGDAKGPCSIFANRLVNAQGWCSAYAKRV